MISALPRRFFRKNFTHLVVLLLVVLLPTVVLAAGTLTIACLDVGQGDATLIISPSGQTLLFDGGKSGRGDSVILPYLNAQGITYLDYMVASHYHSDHIGGLDEVIAQVPVGVAYDRGWSYTTLTYSTYAAAVQEVRETILPGQVIDLGEGVTVTCLALNGNGQLPSPYSNDSYENEYCVSLLVQYGGFDFFVAGDLTGNPDSGYEDIETSVAPLVGDVDVYHVSHHASDSSSNPFFLQTVQAEVSVISLGDNSYGHPHQPVLNRLVQYGSFVYQTEIGSGGTLPATDLRVIGGHVVIETDGLDVYTVAGDQWQIDEESVTPAVTGPLASVRVLGNYPNPFNPRTEIRFETPTAGPARLEVYNLAGRRIAWHSFQAEAGLNLVPWQGQDERGHQQPGGIYLYTVTTAAGRDQGRMTLVK
jgi:competence protein ComEC|nr:MBL fold metallo-hydrolase [Candidatus Krumholzibacteria bacterium]